MKKYIITFIFILITVSMIGGTVYIKQTKSPSVGSLELKGLRDKVTVYKDAFGIPHIEAQNESDLYQAMGYVFASERLFQMELLRRIVNGTLSEVLGEKTLESDILLRKLRFKKNAAEIFKRHKEKYVEALPKIESFIKGMHIYIQNHTLPLEFKILNFTPGPFTPEDIMAVSGYMALTFAEGILQDLLFYDLSDELDPEKLSSLRSGLAGDDYLKFKKFVDIDSGAFLKLLKTLEEINGVNPLLHGSNSWVLSPSRTKSGKALLANDPHIKYSSPGIFFEAHVKSPEFELYGHFIPLVPFAILGHTPYSAWAITMSEVDDMDIYLEKFHPENPGLVMYKNEWVKALREKEIINVKGAKPVEIEVVRTPHGPLINGTKFELKGYAASLAWSVYHPDNNVALAFHELPYAKTVDQFKNAVAQAGAPGLNLSWVNEAGDIAWWVLGKNPKRPTGVRGDIALNGWSGEHEYERYLSIDENPHQVNPENGVIVTANYKPEGAQYEQLEGYWQPSGRYYRIKELLAQQEKWDVEDLKKIQTDSYLPFSSDVISWFTKSINENDFKGIYKDAFIIFNKWDGSSYKDSIASSIFHTWSGFVVQNLFGDELGQERYEIFGKVASFWHVYKYLLQHPTNAWWDDIRTLGKKETARDILISCFVKAIDHLKQNLGGDVTSWRWERVHTLELEHLLGKVSPLNYLYNVGPIGMPGGRYQINNVAHDKSGYDLKAVHGPATRRLIDMKNVRNSQGILPAGNSGNPFDKHFDDQLKLYSEGKYREQIMDWNKIHKLPSFVLTP